METPREDEAEGNDYDDDEFEDNGSVSNNSDGDKGANERDDSIELCPEQESTGPEQESTEQNVLIPREECSISIENSNRSISKKQKRKMFVHLPASTCVSAQPTASRVIDAKMWAQRRARDEERIINMKSTLMQTLSPPKPTPIAWR